MAVNSKGERDTVRTTVEIKDEHRAKLLELAARRGKKGFSDLIGEALDLYMGALEADEEGKRLALASRGSLNQEQARELRERTADLRASWR